MAKHQFGGQWTEEKLARVRKYLPAYTTIFRGNEYARRNYRTIYLDAFAGSGSRNGRGAAENEPSPSLFVELLGDPDNLPETNSSVEGSARLALKVEPQFDRYIFIEKKPEHITELVNLREEYPDLAKQIEIVQGDANRRLREWCENTDWSQWRAVAFLDPYGMEVNWATLEAIANTRAVDLWLLWPIGQAVNRVLPRRKLPKPDWCDALTRVFGTDEWKERFYGATSAPNGKAPISQGSLFEIEDLPETAPIKVAGFEEIEAFFLERLNTLFPFVSPQPLYLSNSQNTPLYLLCFAAHNATALKIANYILK